MKSAGCVLSFLLGAAAGSFGAWRLLKKKYAEKADKEIESVKSAYEKAYGKSQEHTTPSGTVTETGAKDDQESDPLAEKYHAILQRYSGGREEPETDLPYVILPEDYEDLYDYNLVELILFCDGVLTDTMYEEIDDKALLYLIGAAGSIRGRDEFYIRYDSRRCDYDITRDNRTYAEALGDGEEGTYI